MLYTLIFLGVIIFALVARFMIGGWIARLCFSFLYILGPIILIQHSLYLDCRKKQAEPKQTLGTIAMSEDGYVNEHGIYTDKLEELGFVAKSPDEKSRYNYPYNDICKLSI